MAARIVSVCVSRNKGEKKTPVAQVELRPAHGIIGDAHAGSGHRQVSLLAIESIRKMQDMGLVVSAGDFAENLTTEGVELVGLPLGAGVQIGEVLLEVTQIGKECHNRCAIYDQAGDCVMPKEGVFTRVVKGGKIQAGDKIEAPVAI